MSVQVSHELKLLNRKNETDPASAEPATVKGFTRSRILPPTHNIAAYQIQLATWSIVNG